VSIQDGRVEASFIVLACNGYLGKLERRVAGKIMPINNFMIATEPLGEERARELITDRICVHDTRFVVDYFRTSEDHRLLFGGGENYRSGYPKDIAAFVRPYMLKLFPQLDDARIDYSWGGTLSVTVNRLPHVGRLDPNLFFAHGYSGHGVAIANLAGKVIAEAIAGTASRFDVMASLPSYTFPGGTMLRYPGMVLGMLYYSIRDKI
jgi:gamma-glutamylputrescine oxidase